MQRSYKDAKTYEQAMEIMKGVGGTQLDKELLDIFVQIPKEELEQCMPKRVDYSEMDGPLSRSITSLI